MKIGGFQPCSLCDYPGHVAAVIFTQGCNFHCPFCHNAALLPRNVDASRLIRPDEILERLWSRHGKIGAVVVTGGEPTLQADLPQFLREVRALGFRIKLDTNGSRSGVLAALFEAGLLDYVAMDVKAPWERYAELAGLRVDAEILTESVRLVASSGVAHEFRTTAVEQLLNGSDIARIRAQIPPCSSHTVQPFRPQHALSEALRDGVSAGDQTFRVRRAALVRVSPDTDLRTGERVH